MFKTEVKNIRLVNQNILIKPRGEQKSEGGLILPTNTSDEGVTSGFVVRIGPGIPTGVGDSIMKRIEYLPLDVEEGDLAYFFEDDTVEIQLRGEKYYLVAYEDCLFFERFDD